MQKLVSSLKHALNKQAAAFAIVALFVISMAIAIYSDTTLEKIFTLCGLIFAATFAAIMSYKTRRIAIAVRDARREAKEAEVKIGQKLEKIAEASNSQLAATLNTYSINKQSDAEKVQDKVNSSILRIESILNDISRTTPYYGHATLSTYGALVLEERCQILRPRLIAHTSGTGAHRLVNWLKESQGNRLELMEVDNKSSALELTLYEILIIDVSGRVGDEDNRPTFFGKMRPGSEIWVIGDRSSRAAIVTELVNSDNKLEYVVLGEEKNELTILRKEVK